MTLLIDRLHEFSDSPSGVAAFLDECEEKGLRPLLGRNVIPEEHLYRIAMVHFLLIVTEIARECVLEVEVGMDQIVTNRGSKLPVPECLRVAFRSIPWSETAVLLPSQMATYGDKWDEGLRVVIECAQRLPGGDSLSKGFATRLTALRERQTA